MIETGAECLDAEIHQQKRGPGYLSATKLHSILWIGHAQSHKLRLPSQVVRGKVEAWLQNRLKIKPQPRELCNTCLQRFASIVCVPPPLSCWNRVGCQSMNVFKRQTIYKLPGSYLLYNAVLRAPVLFIVCHDALSHFQKTGRCRLWVALAFVKHASQLELVLVILVLRKPA